MAKIFRGFRKVSGGFRRSRFRIIPLPDRLQAVSIREQPLKQQTEAETTGLKQKKPRRKQRTARLGVKSTRKPQEQAEGDSAPTPAPEAAIRATPQRRPAWAGKYGDLTRTSGDD